MGLMAPYDISLKWVAFCLEICLLTYLLIGI